MNKVLLVFEGAKTEPNIYNQIESCLLHSNSKDTKIITSYKTDIYNFYTELRDGDEFLDPVAVLKEKNPDQLQDINSTNDVGAIYLFFDYDLHVDIMLSDQEKNERIESLLNYFNNETENGYLFISYPMIEAYKDWNKPIECQSCIFEISNGYKEMVRRRYPSHDRIESFNFETWILFTQITIARASAMVIGNCNDTDFDSLKNKLTQIAIFNAQKDKFVIPTREIVILSPIPFFLIEELGRSFYNKHIKDGFEIPRCNYSCFHSSNYRNINRHV